ncbi:hypothetical protein C8Q76DRAFT_754551 [Earliella scabrosa]|nr:hypothetical protein C8Q76DRAFT_754551 [Earliella scabrosa]
MAAPVGRGTPDPAMVGADDAHREGLPWIQADANSFGGNNRCLLWKAFASRGLLRNSKTMIQSQVLTAEPGSRSNVAIVQRSSPGGQGQDNPPFQTFRPKPYRTSTAKLINTSSTPQSTIKR